jgi:hypothetical protein
MLIALNQDIAGRLDEVSRILAEQGTNRFRVQAYRQAASAVRGLSCPVSQIFDKEGLGRIRRGLTAPVQRNDATVAELLDVDRQYREQAAKGALQKIAPRRFNPSGEVWLPVVHTTRSPRYYTALFSNTARRMNSTRSRIGWCSTTTVQQRSASAPSSPLNSASSKVNASCADASRNAENTIDL